MPNVLNSRFCFNTYSKILDSLGRGDEYHLFDLAVLGKKKFVLTSLFINNKNYAKMSQIV